MNPLARLRADLQSPKLFRAVTLGWLMGAVIVIHCIALSAIVFSGPMLPYAVQGAGMMLFGGIVFCLLIGVTSSYPGMLAVPQEVPATVLGTLGVVVGGTVSAPGHVQFMTMAALLLLSGLLTGLLFLAVGHFRLSHLFRFIPYPVAGGFFAGTGWVLSLAALSVMSGMALDWQTLPRLFESDMVWKWGPGAAYGLVLGSLPTLSVVSRPADWFWVATEWLRRNADQYGTRAVFDDQISCQTELYRRGARSRRRRDVRPEPATCRASDASCVCAQGALGNWST